MLPFPPRTLTDGPGAARFIFFPVWLSPRTSLWFVVGSFVIFFLAFLCCFVFVFGQIGAVFLTRGIGAGLGNLVAPKLYLWARGKHVVSVALFLLAAFLLAVPLSDDVRTLHLNFLILGFLAAIIDAGCLLMTRRLHGSAAGPWLGANTVAFGVSGALSPLIGWLTGSLMVQYSVLAAVGFIIGFILVVLPRPGVQPPPSEVRVIVFRWRLDLVVLVLGLVLAAVAVAVGGGGGGNGGDGGGVGIIVVVDAVFAVLIINMLEVVCWCCCGCCSCWLVVHGGGIIIVVDAAAATTDTSVVAPFVHVLPFFVLEGPAFYTAGMRHCGLNGCYAAIPRFLRALRAVHDGSTLLSGARAPQGEARVALEQSRRAGPGHVVPSWSPFSLE